MSIDHQPIPRQSVDVLTRPPQAPAPALPLPPDPAERLPNSAGWHGSALHVNATEAIGRSIEPQRDHCRLHTRKLHLHAWQRWLSVTQQSQQLQQRASQHCTSHPP